MGNNTLNNLPGYSYTQHHIRKEQLATGSVKGKREIRLDSKTVIYVSREKSKAEIEAIKAKYLDIL